jgi:hypothetical protein
MRWRYLYLHEVYIVVDRKHVSTIRRDPVVWILLPVERHVQNPHIFIFFLESMHEFELGTEGESSRQQCTLCGHFHVSCVWLYHDTVFVAEVQVLFKLKILLGSGHGIFRLPRLVQYGALRTCASVALVVQLHLAANVRLSTREVYNNTVYAVVCNCTSGVC